MENEFRTVFRVGKRVWIIRLIMWGSLGLSVLLLSLIWGMQPGQDETVSIAEEIALIAFIVIVSIAFPLGMWIYGSCYVARVISNEDESVSYYNTISWFGYRCWTITRDQKGRQQHHRGHSRGFYSANLDFAKMEVNAPYTSQKVKQRRLPFIFDDSGDWYAWQDADIEEN